MGGFLNTTAGQLVTTPDMWAANKVSPGFTDSDVGKAMFFANDGAAGVGNAINGNQGRQDGAKANAVATALYLTGGAASGAFGAGGAGAAGAGTGASAGGAGAVGGSAAGSGAATGVGTGVGAGSTTGASYGSQALPYLQGAGALSGGYANLAQKGQPQGVVQGQASQASIPIAQLPQFQGGDSNQSLMQLLQMLGGGQR